MQEVNPCLEHVRTHQDESLLFPAWKWSHVTTGHRWLVGVLEEWSHGGDLRSSLTLRGCTPSSRSDCTNLCDRCIRLSQP